MPTNKKRLQVTLDDKTYNVISAYAALQGVSKSKAVGDMLEPSIPALERLVDLLTSVKLGDVEVKEGLAQNFVEFVDEFERVLGDEKQSFFDQLSGSGKTH